MSKSARKTQHINRHVKHVPEKPVLAKDNFRIKKIVVFSVIAVLAGIPFILGKYCEFNIPDAFDSGCYVYSAQHILNGARIGVDEMPSAKVGTLLVNMLGVKLFGFSETGPKLIQTLLQVAALFVMFVTMLRLFGILPAAVGVILASFYLSAPVISKWGNVKEQHMIACMILGICFYVLGQMKNKRAYIYLMLAGGFVSWAPLFKETGLSAMGALGLFVLAQPLLKHLTWKKTGSDILLLAAGAIIAISPICLWLAVEKAPIGYYPYGSLWKPVIDMALGSPDKKVEQQPAVAQNKPAESPNNVEAAAAKDTSKKPGLLLRLMPGYVSDSWMALNSEQRSDAFKRVFRWYRVLLLPIALALASVFIRIFRIFSKLRRKSEETIQTGNDRFVFLFAVWWILDMTFVWISPHSYEQYYLPLNASASMLGGYAIMAYREKLKNVIYRPYWVIVGCAGFILMLVLVWPIFFGLSKTPFWGTKYPEKSNGYVQRLKDASEHSQGGLMPWEAIGEYIRENSTEKDSMYVWGWFPGIYVTAQRFSPTTKAFEGTMHILSPEQLSQRVADILKGFRKHPPKFIVDSRKNEFPWDRRPLELWPQELWSVKPGNIQDDMTIELFDKGYAQKLKEDHGEDEAFRYMAMAPLRRYVMRNYKIISHREFGSQLILFQRK
jgi:hypothetical protein